MAITLPHEAKPAKRRPKVLEIRFARDVSVGEKLHKKNERGGRVIGTVSSAIHPVDHMGACNGIHLQCHDASSFNGCYNKHLGKVEVLLEGAVFTSAEQALFAAGLDVVRDRTLDG